MVNKGPTKGFELALFMAYGMFSITMHAIQYTYVYNCF